MLWLVVYATHAMARIAANASVAPLLTVVNISNY